MNSSWKWKIGVKGKRGRRSKDGSVNGGGERKPNGSSENKIDREEAAINNYGDEEREIVEAAMVLCGMKYTKLDPEMEAELERLKKLHQGESSKGTPLELLQSNKEEDADDGDRNNGLELLGKLCEEELQKGAVELLQRKKEEDEDDGDRNNGLNVNGKRGM